MERRKMVNLLVAETSGVDHPAHLREGWIVMKTATEVAQLLEDNVPETAEATAAEEQDAAQPDEAADPAAQLAAAEARIAELEALLAQDEDEEEEDDVAKMLKSAPDILRKAIDDARAEAAAATDELRKERDARADADAIAKARTDYAHLSLDVEAVAPALRRLTATQPDIAKAITDALASANAQNESADIFREVGKSAPADGDAFGQIKGLADGYVTSGAVSTFEQGIAKAATEHPDLYNRYLTEKGR